MWTICTPFAARVFIQETINIQQAIAVTFCTVGAGLSVIGLLISGKIADANLINLHNITLHGNKEIQTNAQANLNIIDILHIPIHDKSIAYELFVGISMGVLDGLSCTGNSILTKKLQPEIENIFILAVYYNITGIFVSLILMLTIERDDLFFPTDVENIMYFTVHSTSKLISSFTLQMALYFASAVTCALTLNANLPLNVLCEYVLFSSVQPLSGGNPIELAGVGIVTLGVVLCPLVDFIQHCSSKQHGMNPEKVFLADQSKQRYNQS